MKIWINGVVRDMTPEEEKEHKTQARIARMAEAKAIAPVDEVVDMIIKEQINNFTVTDKEAYRLRTYYPEWAPGMTVKEGNKVQHADKLWKAKQNHTTQASWEPSINSAALWVEVCESHEGTEDDPIPYDGNMELVEGRYYYQNGTFYKCTRSTGIPVYSPLAELIGLYVEVDG